MRGYIHKKTCPRRFTAGFAMVINYDRHWNYGTREECHQECVHTNYGTVTSWSSIRQFEKSIKIVAWVVTSSSHIGLNAHPTRENHGWHWEPSQPPRAGQVMELGGEPPATTLLTQHHPQHSMNVCPQCHRQMQLSLLIKETLQQTGIITENHSWP